MWGIRSRAIETMSLLKPEQITAAAEILVAYIINASRNQKRLKKLADFAKWADYADEAKELFSIILGFIIPEDYKISIEPYLEKKINKMLIKCFGK